MEQEKDKFKKEYREITIKTTDGSTFFGKVNIGIKGRVSELFTKTEGSPFIVLFDVELAGASDKILFVNKSHIVWVEPED